MTLVTLQSRIRQPQSESAKQAAYRRLKADIVKGVFDMGQRLNESQLALRYGVGKTPVREALGVLQQEGLVEVVPRVGYLTSRVTVQDVDNIFDLRKIVEGAAAEKAATAITEESLQHLEQVHWDFGAGDRESYLRFLEENSKFHCTIAEASGNQRLVEVVTWLLEQTQRLIILKLDLSTGLDELVEQHRQILAALRQRDPAQVRDAMISDVTGTHEAVLYSLKKLIASWHI